MPGPSMAGIFGNNWQTTSVTRDHASIGELTAIVCNDRDLKEDLISVNPQWTLDLYLPWNRTTVSSSTRRLSKGFTSKDKDLVGP